MKRTISARSPAITVKEMNQMNWLMVWSRGPTFRPSTLQGCSATSLRSQPMRNAMKPAGVDDGDRRQRKQNGDRCPAQEGLRRRDHRHACRCVRSPRTRTNNDGQRGPDGCEHGTDGEGEVGIPDRKAEIVESLAIIPAARSTGYWRASALGAQGRSFFRPSAISASASAALSLPSYSARPATAPSSLA